LGLRVDFNNIYGTFVTPRFHAKYNFTDNLVIRISAGKGYRTANVLAENTGVFVSSRTLIIKEDFKPEEAWNYGTNFTAKFKVAPKRELVFNLDFYRTDFINQVIADIDTKVNEISFCNLTGKSYSNSFMIDMSVEPINRFEITAAFRYNDVKITMNNNLIEKPFVNKYKGLLTLSYATKFEKWKIDITNQFIGSSSLPNTSQNPTEFQLDKKSPAYFILHAQITKKFKLIDIYAGVENITDYKQKHPIIDPQNPFGDHFDASMIWGPISGRMFYAGLRFKIK